MANKLQAESYAREDAWKHKQRMYVVARDSQFFAASDLDLKRLGGKVVSTFDPIKRRAGARQS
jgi:hypothetical protein